MKYMKFVYKDSPRKVYVTQQHIDFVEGIDVSHLSPEEAKEFESYVEDFYQKIQPFIKKAFRRFLREKMAGIPVEAPFKQGS